MSYFALFINLNKDLETSIERDKEKLKQFSSNEFVDHPPHITLATFATPCEKLLDKITFNKTEILIDKKDYFSDNDLNYTLYYNIEENSSLNNLHNKAVDIVEKTHPDLIDINFGCPVKKVVSKGAGAGILKNLDLMESLTKEIVKRTSLPVTVKTRLGWDHESIKIIEVAERLQDVGCRAIAIHGRTRAQMYKGDADWTYIEKVKNNPRMKIPVFANGDINTPERAEQIKNLGLDGAMIGRASIGNPWFFNQVKHYLNSGTHLKPATIPERVEMAKRHLEMAIAWKGERLGIYETRRHYSNYFKGIPGFKPYRQKLVTTDEPDKVYSTLNQVLEVF